MNNLLNGHTTANLVMLFGGVIGATTMATEVGDVVAVGGALAGVGALIYKLGRDRESVAGDIRSLRHELAEQNRISGERLAGLQSQLNELISRRNDPGAQS